jgi:GAF domain-containing protein
LQVICHEACTAFGVAHAVLWLVDPPPTSLGDWVAWRRQERSHSQSLVAAAATGSHMTRRGSQDAPTHISFADELSPAIRAIRERRGVIINAMSDASRAAMNSKLPQPAALLITPLFASGGAPLGALTLGEANDPERFDDDDLEHARLFAVQAAIAIETGNLHAHIRTTRTQAEAQQARWKAAIDDLPALVCICDTELRMTYVSPACAQVLGWPASGDEAALLRPEDSRDNVATGAAQTARQPEEPMGGIVVIPFAQLPLAQAMAENRTVHGKMLMHRCPDGIMRLVSWDAAPISIPTLGITGAVAVGRDVTEEHRQREREMSLAAVTRASAGAPNSTGGADRATRVMHALAEATSKPVVAATLYLLNAEEETLQRVGSFGGDRTRTHAPAVPLNRHHPWWRVLIAGPLYSTPDGAGPRWLREIGLGIWAKSNLRAWATIPLRVGSNFVGALSVGLNVPLVWDAAERAWIEACADAVAVGVEIDRLFAAERRHVGELERALIEVSRTSQLDDPAQSPSTELRKLGAMS